MWQNRNVQTSIGGVYTFYKLSGLNLDRFINVVANRGVSLFKIKKKGNKQLTFCINVKENQKFFAIINKLWYNNQKCTLESGQTIRLNGGYALKRVRDLGRFYPFYFLYKNLGMLLGIVLFAFLFTYSNNYVFDIKYIGSGSVYKEQVGQYLEEKGVKKFSKFSRLDLDLIASDVLANNDNLTFVDCYKEGNRLVVNLVLSVSPPQVLDETCYQLVSDEDGVVEDVKVYRGTALVSQGQTVKKGDVLVDGFVCVKEETIKVNVLCKVVLLCEFEFTYSSKSAGEEDIALVLAKTQLGDRQIVWQQVDCERQPDESFNYTILLRYRKLLCAG